MWKWLAAAAAAAAAAALLRSSYERRSLAADEYHLTSEKLKRDRTFVFLSDLHDSRFGPGQSRLLEAVDRIKPDGILIGGDMMVVKERADTEAALFLVKKLASVYPVYYGNGNHENRMDRRRSRYGNAYDRYVRGLREAGVRHLSDTSVDIDDDIRVSGLDLDEYYYKKFRRVCMDPGYIEAKLGKASKDRYQILLAHSPKFHGAYAAWGADLALAGHYHGGTVRIPRLGGLMTPQFEFFQKTCDGLLEEKGKYMLVSRGLGTHTVNIRLNNLPQLAVIKLGPPAGQGRGRAKAQGR